MNHVAPSEQKCRFLDADNICSDSSRICSYLNDIQGQIICEDLTIEYSRKRNKTAVQRGRGNIQELRFSDGADVDEEVENYLKAQLEKKLIEKNKIPTP